MTYCLERLAVIEVLEDSLLQLNAQSDSYNQAVPKCYYLLLDLTHRFLFYVYILVDDQEIHLCILDKMEQTSGLRFVDG